MYCTSQSSIRRRMRAPSEPHLGESRGPSAALRIRRRMRAPSEPHLGESRGPSAAFRIRRRMRALSERESASRTGLSASFLLPQPPMFSATYKRVRILLKTNTFKSLYSQSVAHSLSLFSCKSFICVTYAKQPRGIPQKCPILGFSTPTRKVILRKVRKLTPLFSISSARFGAFAQLTFPRNPFSFYSLRTFSDNYGGWGTLRTINFISRIRTMRSGEQADDGYLFHQFIGVTDGNRQVRAAKIV